MHIDIYKQEDGSYIINDCYYKDAEEVLGDIIHSCGCGSPSTAIKYVADILQTIQDKDYKEVEAFFKSEGEFYFVLYNLDHLRFTEHGTSIGFSWLTDKGKKFLEDAKEYLSTIEE